MNNIQFYIIQLSSFYVEISIDNIMWESVVDESQSKHFGPQTWNFDKKIGKYIRVVGTRLWDRIYSSERMPWDFQLQALKVFYKDSKKPNHTMIKLPAWWKRGYMNANEMKYIYHNILFYIFIK